MHKQVSDGYTMRMTGTWDSAVGFYTVPNAATGTKVPVADLNALNIEATFAGCNLDPVTQKCNLGSSAHPGLVQVADTMETSFYAMGEWMLYQAFFFNREKEVQEVTDTSRERWLCHSNNNDFVDKNKVLLLDYFNVSYPDYATYKGWELKACQVCADGSEPVTQVGEDVFTDLQCVHSDGSRTPALPSTTYRWCEMLKAAGAHPLNADLHKITAFKDQAESAAVGPWKGYQMGSKSGLTNAQLIEFAKEVDVIILLTGGCNEWLDENWVNLHTPETCNHAWTALFAPLGWNDGIKAVRDKQVWDLQRALHPSGGVDFLSHAVVEPDVLLEDTIKAISLDASKATKAHTYQFMRNTYSDGWGNKDPCTADKTTGCVPKADDLVKQCSGHTIASMKTAGIDMVAGCGAPQDPAPTVSGGSTSDGAGSTSDGGGGIPSLPIIGGAVGVVLIGIAVV